MNRKIIDIIFILIWMTTIFYFSHQPSSISGETSETISKRILEITNVIEKVEIEKRENVISNFDYIIRKMAHYTIYTIGGLLIFLFVDKFEISKKIKVLYSFIFGVVYASTDELHQHFIPGRACMWQDVCLDSIGVLTGIMIMLLIITIIEKNKKKMKQNFQEKYFNR